MNHGLLKAKLAIGALALAAATLSHASSTTLVGGGATLPAIGYVGTTAQTNRQVFPAGTGSWFAAFSAVRGNPTISYCQTGSGAGKNILASAPGAGFSVQNACTVSPNTGFGASLAGRTDLTFPNFAGADSPLSQTDVNNYRSGHSNNFPAEFPAIAGSISIPMNMKTTLGVVLSKSNTHFTSTQLCDIFSGKVTFWDDPSLTTGSSVAYTLGSGDSIPHTQINVVYRSDGSGTTFSFMNHLAAVCPGTSTSPARFKVDQSFATAVSPSFPSGLPANWVPESGNPNVVGDGITNHAASIGYAETTNSVTAGVNYALVDGKDPVNDFAGPSFTASQILFNNVVTGTDSVTGRPTVGPLSTLPSTSCIALVDPAAYANPSSGYPLMAVSYLLGHQSGNSSNANSVDLANVRNFLGLPYNSAISWTPPGGLAKLTVPSTVLSTSVVSTCIN